MIIILFVVLMLPGQPPIKHHEAVQSLNECLTSVHDILTKGAENRVNIQAGCVLQPVKQEGT